MNIQEDYVSFETAKLLREKGFKESTLAYAYGQDMIGYYSQPRVTDDYNVEARRYPLPTLQIAMKWLREVHKISIEITSTGHFIDNDVEWECDIKAGHRLYFRHITNEKSFELCAEAALKYCLEDLI